MSNECPDQGADESSTVIKSLYSLSIFTGIASASVGATIEGIFLDNASVDNDLAVDSVIGNLYMVGGEEPVASFTITTNPNNLFKIANTNELQVSASMAAYGDTTQDVTIQVTDNVGQTGSFTKTITIASAGGDNGSGLPDGSGTGVTGGTWNEVPVDTDASTGLVISGKSGGLVKYVYDIGGPPADGDVYTIKWTADWSNLRNEGRETFVGFGFLDTGLDDFHLVGTQGDGLDPTTLNLTKVTGTDFSGSAVSVTTDSAATSGTKDGSNYVKLEITDTGTTYIFSTTDTGRTPIDTGWDVEYNGVAPTPTSVANSDAFGIAVYIPKSDRGPFSITIEEWQTTTSFAGAAASMSATAQDYTAGDTELTLTSEIFDTDTWFTASSTDIVIPSGVTYAQMTVTGYIEAMSTNDATRVLAYKNNASYVGQPVDHDENAFASYGFNTALSAVVPVVGGTDIFSGYTFVIGDTSVNETLFTLTAQDKSSFMGGALAFIDTNRTSLDFSSTGFVTWDDTVYDTDSAYSGASPTRLTVPSGVSYARCVGQVQQYNIANTSNYYMELNRNGAIRVGLPRCGNYMTSSNGYIITNLASAIVPVSSGQYFEFKIYNSDTAVDINANNNSFFSVEWLGTPTGALVYDAGGLTGKNCTGGGYILDGWDTETYDNGDWWTSGSPSRLTVPAGVSYVRVGASIYAQNVSTGDGMRVDLMKNGSQVSVGACSRVNSTDKWASFMSHIIPVSQDDYFQIRVITGSDTSVDFVAGTQAWFSIEQVA